MRETVVFVLLVIACISLTKAEPICSTCSCKDVVVDCSNLGLKHLNESNWPNATEKRLEKARFDGNELVHITGFPPLALTYLSLSHNKIVRIEIDSFMNLTNLTELDLSHNHLTSDNLVPNIFEGKFRPDDLKPLPLLKVLRLGSNALHTLNQELFIHTPNIKVLSLDSNPFRALDTVTTIALTSLSYLEVLDLSYTELKELPPYLLHTPLYLKVLNLTGNLMTEVPTVTLSHNHALEELHFCENPVKVLDKTNGFNQGLSYLRVLYLSYMDNLTHIDSGALSNLPALEEVHITHNRELKDIHPDAFSWHPAGEESEQWPRIKKLNLEHNHLSSLDVHLLAHWDTLEYLNLIGNNWLCDCENQWMVSTLLPSIEKIVKDQLDYLVCSEPEEMRNKNLHDLSVRHYHMRCLDADGHQPEKDAKLLVGILVGVLLAVPLTVGSIVLIRRTRFGSGLFSRRHGPADYSRTFYSRADSGEFQT